MSRVKISVDEAIATLQHSSDPTLIAEGTDDIVFLRRLEDRFEEEGLSIFPLGGRDSVLKLFDRRSEITSARVLFLADQDQWVYTGCPAGYVDDDLLFTDGYSIENDLFRDGQMERLLTKAEDDQFRRDLQRFLEWYALALTRHLANSEVPLSVHPAALLDDPARFAADMQLLAGESYPQAELEALQAAYPRQLRGKSLIALLMRQLSKKGRVVKHSAKSLLEHGSVAEGVFYKRIADWIAAHLPPAMEARP